MHSIVVWSVLASVVAFQMKALRDMIEQEKQIDNVMGCLRSRL